MALRRKSSGSSPWEQFGNDDDDRRSARRYPARGAPARLAWAGEKGFRTDPILLRNLSLGGALALIGERPAAGSRVRVSLRDKDPAEWIEATVVRVRRSRVLFPGPFLVSLRFAESCPYDVFKAVVGVLGTCAAPSS